MRCAAESPNRGVGVVEVGEEVTKGPYSVVCFTRPETWSEC